MIDGDDGNSWKEARRSATRGGDDGGAMDGDHGRQIRYDWKLIIGDPVAETKKYCK